MDYVVWAQPGLHAAARKHANSAARRGGSKWNDVEEKRHEVKICRKPIAQPFRPGRTA
jgi:hypothetical protein